MGLLPRVVLVTRPTDLEALVASHGTVSQARFFLESRGQKLEPVETAHHRFQGALQMLLQALPPKWRLSRLGREDLPGFVFEPEDLVAVMGPDGLVANAAKYLEGQLVLGFNPDPGSIAGVLVKHPPESAPELYRDALVGRVKTETRTMVEVALDDGQRLKALNEIFIGHRSHQSARYRLISEGKEERQSSSGLLVSSGTGATGWAKSVRAERKTALELPTPEEARLAFFVREAWPSPFTGTSITSGSIGAGQRLEVVSELNDGGCVFGDGLEADRLEFPWGVKLQISIARSGLRLAV